MRVYYEVTVEKQMAYSAFGFLTLHWIQVMLSIKPHNIKCAVDNKTMNTTTAFAKTELPSGFTS